MSSKLAHSVDENERTSDICFKESTPFSKMLLKDGVKKGLDNCGFLYPTVIQANAIPVGKAGIDLLCQSKSGTGKTLIFCTILLEQYQEIIREPQSLVLVPTREIALQIEGILNQVGEHLPGFRAVTVIGGLEVTNDRKKLANAKAVVGTPGRVLHLIQNEMLNTSKITLFIIDEADKLMSKTFLSDFQKINKSLPKKKQIIACSATFCDDLDKKIASYMKNPLLVSTDKGATLLVGIKQFIYDIPEEKTSILEMSSKLKALKKLFSKISFKQCLAFASSQSRAESYKNALEKDGWPCEVITGAQDQKTRIEIFKIFKEFRTRILISTDLMARGIDSEHVNLVLNIEPPDDGPTYLHRIGRAGRFGSHGIAITFISSQKESQKFKIITETIGSGLNIFRYPYNESIDLWNFTHLEKENVLEVYTFYEDHANKTTGSDKENINDLNTSSNSAYIDSKTYKIEYMDDPNANKIMLTETMSSLQRLPSSNTIDDASSIAPDSDVLRSNSIGSKDLTVRKRPNNNSMSLLEVLIDNSKSSSTEQIDLFEDYKSFDANLNESPAKSKTEETEKLNLKDLLVDTKKFIKPTKDAFSEYEKLKEKGDDITDSNSYSVTLSQQYEPSAGTSRVPMEQLKLNIPEVEGDSSQSHQNKLQKPHFPSPNNIDELVKVNLNPIVLPPPESDSTNDSVASNASSSFEGISSSSSGFDERTTSAKSSGISTSTNENEEDDDDDDDDSFDYNASVESDDSEEDENESYEEDYSENDDESEDDDNTVDGNDNDEETYQTSDSDEECNINNVSDIVGNEDVSDNINGNFKNYKKFVKKENNIFNSQNFHDLRNDLGTTSANSDENIHSNQNSSDQNFIYQNAYARWTDLYWNQMTQIQDYVKFCSYVHNNSNI